MNRPSLKTERVANQRESLGPIRPFVKDDIPQVADLHQRVFGVDGKPAEQPISAGLLKAYADYFESIFLRHPWRDETLPSLVYEDRDGRVTGFLGVMARPMSFRGQPIRAAISSQFIVEPDTRSTGAGVRLMKAFLSGPQDFSLTDEANNASRKLWEALGGTTASLHSIHWTRWLRPSRYAVSLCAPFLEKRRLLSPLARAARPFCNLIDAAAARRLPHRFSLSPPEVEAEEMNLERLLVCLSAFSDARALWPEYDHRSLSWLLKTIAQKNRRDELRQLAIRNARGETIGWYIYLLKPEGASHLLQVATRKAAIGEVLDHLFHDAWQRGSLAISGRLEPQFMQAFADRYCQFRCGSPWMLIHSRDPELLQSIRQGDALLSRLEGEWCARFR